MSAPLAQGTPATVWGVDVSSAPSRSRPMRAARCRLYGGVLTLEELPRLERIEDLDAILIPDPPPAGPWIAGLDAPLGLPRALLAAWGWEELGWAGYVAAAEGLGWPALAARLTAFCAARPAGAKEPPRLCDALARASSSMKRVNPPTARLFLTAAPAALRAARAGACVPPFVTGCNARTILEVYPALVARAIIGRTSYKGGTAAVRSTRRDARNALLAELPGWCAARLGLKLEIAAEFREELLADRCADGLDALLCAVLAAWALGRDDLGVPAGPDPAGPDPAIALEGWIAAPAELLQPATRR